MRRVVAFAFMIGYAVPPTLRAQALGFLDRVFGSVSDVSASRLFGKAYLGRGVISGSRLTGLAIEVTFDAGTIWRRAEDPKKRDSTLTEVRVRYEGGAVRESTLVYRIEDAECEKCSRLDAELGFGYTILQGIRGVSGIQGAIEELPMASVYFVWYPDFRVQPYFGLITGLAQVKDFRAVGDSGLISASGSTFEYGALVGVGVKITKGAYVIGEIAWVAREFEGLSWSSSGGPAFVPTALQAPIRLSTRIIAIGGQIHFSRGSQ